MIGLSLSFCVRDILDGKVAVEDVECIVAGTAAETDEDWECLVVGYAQSYWRKHSMEQIAP